MFCCQVKANTGPLMRGNILDMWELNDVTLQREFNPVSWVASTKQALQLIQKCLLCFPDCCGLSLGFPETWMCCCQWMGWFDHTVRAEGHTPYRRMLGLPCCSTWEPWASYLTTPATSNWQRGEENSNWLTLQVTWGKHHRRRQVVGWNWNLEARYLDTLYCSLGLGHHFPTH